MYVCLPSLLHMGSSSVFASFTMMLLPQWFLLFVLRFVLCFKVQGNWRNFMPLP